MWIEDLINNDTLLTGLLCSEDVDLIESAIVDEDSGLVNESIDIIGHNFHNLIADSNVKSTNFLSYAMSQDRINQLTNSDNEDLTYVGELEFSIKESYVYFIN